MPQSRRPSAKASQTMKQPAISAAVFPRKRSGPRLLIELEAKMFDKLCSLSIFHFTHHDKTSFVGHFGGFMTTAGKKLTQRVIAIVEIVAVLDRIGISPTVIVFFVVAGFLVWR